MFTSQSGSLSSRTSETVIQVRSKRFLKIKSFMSDGESGIGDKMSDRI